jgi:hypothetical protein
MESVVGPVCKRCKTVARNVGCTKKILSNILLSGLTTNTDGIAGDCRFGFWHERSITYHIFCIAQILDN